MPESVAVAFVWTASVVAPPAPAAVTRVIKPIPGVSPQEVRSGCCWTQLVGFGGATSTCGLNGKYDGSGACQQYNDD